MLDISRWAGDGVGAVPSIIRSIQHIDVSATTFPITINEVNPDCSIIILANNHQGHGSWFQGLYFASPTSIGSVYSSGNLSMGSIMVVEFEPGWVKFKQTGVVTNNLNTSPPGPVALTQAVNPDKCLLFVHSYYETDDRLYVCWRAGTLSSTEITFVGYVYAAPYNTLSYQLIELR